MCEDESPREVKGTPVSRGAIDVHIRIEVEEPKHEGANPVDEVNKILDKYVKPEYRGRIALIEIKEQM